MATDEMSTREASQPIKSPPLIHIPKKYVLILLVVLAAVSGVIWLTASSSPTALLAQSRRYEATDLRRALSLVKSAIEGSPEGFPAAQVHRCRLLVKLKLNAEAETAFQAIRRPEDCLPQDLIDLALAAKQGQNYRLAASALRAAGADSQQRPDLLKVLIEVEFESGQREQTLALCQAYAKAVPDDPFPWLISASLHHEHNDVQLAFQAYLNALACPLSPKEENRVRFQACQLALLLGDIPQARRQRDAIDPQGLDVQSQQALSLQTAELLHREGKTSEAVSLLDQFANAPGLVTARAMRGSYRYELGDLQGAIRDLLSVVQQDRFHQPAHYRLSQAYLKLGDTESAAPYLKRSQELVALTARILTVENQLRNDLSNWQLRLQLADLNEQRGERQAAEQWRHSADRYRSEANPAQ